MKYIFSLILTLALLTSSFAQEDSVKFKFRTVRIGVDALGLLKTAVIPNSSALEVSAEADFTKYIFSVDIGRSSFSLDSLPRYNYDGSGTYFRLGADVNFLSKDEDKSVIFFGLRYGNATLDDEITYQYESEGLGVFDLIASNENARANWIEVNIGMKARIWKKIWMGYRANYKIGLNISSQNFQPFRIPGYGPSETNTDSNSTWGFNYYIMYGF